MSAALNNHNFDMFKNPKKTSLEQSVIVDDACRALNQLAQEASKQMTAQLGNGNTQEFAYLAQTASDTKQTVQTIQAERQAATVINSKRSAEQAGLDTAEASAPTKSMKAR